MKMNLRKKHRTTAWAIYYHGGLLLKDYRAPLYWLRKLAVREAAGFPGAEIVKVNIAPVK